MGTRALEGRRTEALDCRPIRAGRVFAPISRWVLHRLISSDASGAEEHILECDRIATEDMASRSLICSGVLTIRSIGNTPTRGITRFRAKHGSRNLGSESRRLVVKSLRASALRIRQPRYSSETVLDYPHLIVIRPLLSLRFLHELLINLLIRFIQSPHRFKRQTRQFFLF